jgi:hypothetical protein
VAAADALAVPKMLCHDPHPGSWAAVPAARVHGRKRDVITEKIVDKGRARSAAHW